MIVDTLPWPGLAERADPQLTPELAEVLEQYLLALERGERPDAQQIIEKYPDWGEPLREYLASIDVLHASIQRGRTREQSDSASTASDARQLGDYRIVREIGRGGMGVVYEALQLSLGRRVAPKVLPLAIGLDQRQINRFKNEAQAAAQLQHPHIVPVHWVGCEQGVHCYAMQYIEGRSLEQRIQELSASGDPSGPEHWRLVARVGLDAAEALEHAHQSGVVHRDIKPSNLLLDTAGKLWITDFGLARFQSDAALTRSGELLGTLRYMSPEQLRGQPGLVDQRTDVYSLGITLYELLTLRPAFAAKEQLELMRQVEAAEPPAPRRLNRQVPRDLETVLLKTIAKQREERYSTAGELAEEFRRFLAGEPTQARRPTAVERSYRWAQRHIRLVTAAAILALIALTATSAATLLIVRQKQHTERALLEARDNYTRAERNFQQARQIVDRFWTRAAGKLADLPGAEPLRIELLGEARAYYRSFIQQARHGVPLQADLASACFRVGEISEQLGADEDALSAYEEARQLWRQLLERQPDAELESHLALCENNLALLQGRRGELKAAEELLRSAIGRQRRLAAAQPQTRRFRSQLATSLNNLGLQMSQAGRPAAAEQAYQEVIGLHQRLLAEADDPQCRSDLAAAYNNLGYLQSGADPAASQQAYQQAIDLQTQLAERFPTAPRLRSDLAQTYNNAGAIANRLGDVDAAARCYQQAMDLQEQLVQAAPLAPAYRKELAVTCNNLGFLLVLASHSPFNPATFAGDAFLWKLDASGALVHDEPEEPTQAEPSDFDQPAQVSGDEQPTDLRALLWSDEAGIGTSAEPNEATDPHDPTNLLLPVLAPTRRVANFSPASLTHRETTPEGFDPFDSTSDAISDWSWLDDLLAPLSSSGLDDNRLLSS